MADPSDREKLSNLLEYVQAEGRTCPMPQQWNRLWEMLPGRQRMGAGWQPPAPLILAAWEESSAVGKRERLMTHIRYAAEHGALDQVDQYLRGLSANEWAY